MEKLTRQEKKAARALGVTAADVFPDGCNSYGRVYGLYNAYYYTRRTFCGSYSEPEIYRALLRDLLEKCGFYNIVHAEKTTK